MKARAVLILRAGFLNGTFYRNLVMSPSLANKHCPLTTTLLAIALLWTTPVQSQFLIHGTIPDAGLIAAVDAEADYIEEGTVEGDFEESYPGIYPGFTWTRDVHAIGTNGLLRLDYTVKVDASRRRHRQTEQCSSLSILLFRPGRLRPAGIREAAQDHSGQRPFISRSSRAQELLKLLERILIGVQMYPNHMGLYEFKGDGQSATFVSKLPPDLFGPSDLPHRVTLHMQATGHHRNTLLLDHRPLLHFENEQPAVLANDVAFFELEYLQRTNGVWSGSWNSTNELPKLIRINLAIRKSRDDHPVALDMASRLVSIPASPPLPTPVGVSTNGPPGGGERPTTPRLPRVESATIQQVAEQVDAPPGPIDFHWAARSGIELAQEILAKRIFFVDMLNQVWTGSIQLRSATVTVRIEDRDRKFNINAADEIILRQSTTLLGIDEATAKVIVDSILDWRDTDDINRENGTESSEYQTFTPGYRAKNYPIDYMPELLWIRGVTPSVYSGLTQFFEARLVTWINVTWININTTSPAVLQLFPGIDENIAHAIISGRTGPDGVDGTADDMPYRGPQDLARVPGLPPELLQGLIRFLSVRSQIFDVWVQVDAAAQTRQFHGVLQRLKLNSYKVLNLYEE